MNDLNEFDGIMTDSDKFLIDLIEKIYAFIFSEVKSVEDFIKWMQKKLIPFTLIASLILIIFIVLVRRLNSRGNNKKSKEPGTKGLKKTFKLDKVSGIFLGKIGMKYLYSPNSQERHLLLFGTTGVGKTTGFIIPTLITWIKKGTALVFEIAGDIRKHVPDPNRFVYEPENPENKVHINLFGLIDRIKEPRKKNRALQILASWIIPYKKNEGGTSAYYLAFGRKILAAALKAFYSVGMDFIPICRAIYENDHWTLYEMIESTGHPAAIRSVQSFRRVSESYNAAAKQVVDMALELYVTDPDLADSIGRDSKDMVGIDPQMLEDHSIYISISDENKELYQDFLTLICKQYMYYFSGRKATRKTNPILFCLDEFSSFGHLDILSALRKYRKHKIRIIAATQSLADLELNYGRAERTAMIDNFGLIAVLSATDPDSQEYIARMIGKETVIRTNTTFGSSNTTTEVETRDWIIDPDDLAYLGDDYVLIHRRGYAIARKVPFYEIYPDIESDDESEDEFDDESEDEVVDEEEVEEVAEEVDEEVEEESAS